MKTKIGTSFQLPEKYKDYETLDIGGYKFISVPDEGILVQGLSTVNIFDCQVGVVGLLPLTPAIQKETLGDNFEVEEDRLVHEVSYSGYGWFFLDKKDAYAFVGMLYDIKEGALSKSIKESK